MGAVSAPFHLGNQTIESESVRILFRVLNRTHPTSTHHLLFVSVSLLAVAAWFKFSFSDAHNILTLHKQGHVFLAILNSNRCYDLLRNHVS